MTQIPLPAAMMQSTNLRAPDRRTVLKAASLLGLSLATKPAFAQSETGTKFERNGLLDMARELAKKPFAPQPAAPDWIAGINSEMYQGIHSKPQNYIWNDDNRGFAIEPLHRGFVYSNKVMLSLVENDESRAIAYSAENFDLGKVKSQPEKPDFGYSGLRIWQVIDGQKREIAIIQGGCLIRAIAAGQNFGTASRALAIRTADQRGEEFPSFSRFWIERPTPSAPLIIHAMIDSESLVAVFRLTIRASETTTIDAEANIFPRVALDHIGIAPLQTTYLYGWNDRRGVDDQRPSVFEASGLSMLSGKGEWIWRPLINPKQLQISAFIDENPKGFGLLQRDRNFQTFQDHDNRFELRPSLWIEPLNEWREGTIHLVEIPSDNEVNDNIIVAFKPKEVLKPQTEYGFSWRQHWCWQPPERTNLATANLRSTKLGTSGKRRRFFIDFNGEALAGLPVEDVKPILWASNNGVSNIRLLKGPDPQQMRLIYDVDAQAEPAIELRMALLKGEQQISETVLYRWSVIT